MSKLIEFLLHMVRNAISHGRIIFLPGFSTAEKITGISGRGVGPDIVKTGIERLGGNITLKSNPGTGTTVILEVPFQYFRMIDYE